uniref:Poly [ADP-ribose] polymerase n=1 Tax=Phallusia mammillata TaxID=59560 RepID=A0A6F9DML3_9ASCI|nr:poly [ADP-ribose] polymerase 15-like [Phallusia mammillata]
MEYTVGQMGGKLKRISTGKQGLPSHWINMGGAPWMKVFVDRESEEFASVERKLRASNPSIQMIIKVERIQNPPLYEQYQLKKKDVARHMITKHPVERELFHGTSEEDANSICAHGFDRGFAGKHATLYGKGSYFSTDSSFAAQYARPSGHLYHMFLANVITGDYCKGNPSLMAPPAKVASGNANKVYDSVVNDMSSPSIFVVFKDSSVYPTYLIVFK